MSITVSQMEKRQVFWPDSIAYFVFHTALAAASIWAARFLWINLDSPGAALAIALLAAAIIILGRFYSKISFHGQNIWGPPIGTPEALLGPAPISINNGLIRIDLARCYYMTKKNGFIVKGCGELAGFVIFISRWKFAKETLDKIEQLLTDRCAKPQES